MGRQTIFRAVRRSLSGVCALGLVATVGLTALATPAAAASSNAIDTTSYNVIAKAYMDTYLPKLAVAPGWTQSPTDPCDPGAVTPAARQATYDVVNFFRGMAKLDAVAPEIALERSAQQAALIMHANNNLSHFPASHSPPWKCLAANPDGVTAAAKSNLAIGFTTGPGFVGTVGQGVAGQMRDMGAGNEAAGHRRWLLTPQIATMAAGSTSNTNAVRLLDTARNPGAANPGWIPWPTAGYFPVGLLPGAKPPLTNLAGNAPGARWSISYENGNQVLFANATVSVTDVATGARLPVTVTHRSTNTPGVDGPAYLNGVKSIVFDVAGVVAPVGAEERAYAVTVAGVSGLPAGVPTTFAYQVILFHPTLKPTPGTAPAPTGPAEVGRTLTAGSVAWTHTPDQVAVQWLRDGAAIPGATGKTYPLTAADLGKKIAYRLVAKKAGKVAGTSWADGVVTSAAAGPVVASGGATATPGTTPSASPTGAGVPVSLTVAVAGTPAVGQVLTATALSKSPACAPVSFAYQWFRGATAIAGATGTSYQVQAADVGQDMSVQVTGTSPACAPGAGKAAVGPATAVPTPTTSPGPAASGTTTARLAGPDRYHTAVAISRSYFGAKAPHPKAVYIASGEVFPDALSLAPVAALEHSPLLLVPSAALPQVVADEIRRLKPGKIVVAGGPGAVSETVFAALKSLVADTVRIGGVDRYDSSHKIAEYGMNVAKVFPAGKTSTAFVATGTDFPDALAAGAVAGLRDIAAPVILVPGTAAALPAQTHGLLGALGATKVAAVGGTGVVGHALFGSIPAKFGPVRVAGADRYHTSQAIVHAFRVPATPAGPHTERGVLATGLNFPDALAGATYVAASGSTLWVVPPSCVPHGVMVTGSTLGLGHYDLLGGPGALHASVENLAVCG